MINKAVIVRRKHVQIRLNLSKCFPRSQTRSTGGWPQVRKPQTCAHYLIGYDVGDWQHGADGTYSDETIRIRIDRTHDVVEAKPQLHFR